LACSEHEPEKGDVEWSTDITPVREVVHVDDHMSEGFLASLDDGKILLLFRLDPASSSITSGIWSTGQQSILTKKIKHMQKTATYHVKRLKQPMPIDGNWDKAPWQETEALNIDHFAWVEPLFRPVTQAKMRYDNTHLYVIFHVQDRYVRCQVRDYNGPVYDDSCVEFFFSPNTDLPDKYFNLEVNCIGTPLMHYNRVPRQDITELEVNDIKNIEIASSLPKELIFPETSDPVTWTIEYKIPLRLLEKYAKITRPEKGVVWKANFFKIASGINTHYASWAALQNDKPDFHLPQFFGILKFI